MRISTSALRDRIPVPLKSRIITASRATRLPTARWRRLPDLLIIGTMRGGTTSLHEYLAGHPEVQRPLHKEIEYFTTYYSRGPQWYRSNFSLARADRDRPDGSGLLAFDNSPVYLLAPRAAERAVALLPRAKVIALLREPVARAFSHYQLNMTYSREPLTFREAVAAESDRLAGEMARILSQDVDMTPTYRHFSYATRGMYVDQLRRWTSVYPSEQILILRSEDLYEDTPGTFARILDFLELSPWQPPTFEIHSWRIPESVRQIKLDPETRSEMVSRFEPHNHRLYEFLGRDLGW